MFTGIIRTTGYIQKIEKTKVSLFLTIEKPRGWKIKTGDSVAVNGTCLTVRESRIMNRKSQMVFECMPETLSKTTFGSHVPIWVNLELPMRLSDKAHGHFVTGHVDGVGKIVSIKKKGISRILEISYPKKFVKFVVPKGSIAVDGVSLTIVDVWSGYFSVSLVSYTLEHTTLGGVKKGDLVNLEFDILAKYGSRSKKRTI